MSDPLSEHWRVSGMTDLGHSDAAAHDPDSNHVYPRVPPAPVLPAYVRGQGRMMWDPFGSRWVEVVKVGVIHLPENDGDPEESSYWRSMLYLHDGRLFYIQDSAADEETPPGAPGTPVDPREIWPACTGDEMIAPDVASRLSEEDEEDTDFYIKRIDPLDWSPGDDQTRVYFHNEFRLYEHLRKHPHAGICEYRGCLTEHGLVTAIVLKRYGYTLETAYREGVRTGAITMDGPRIIAQIRSAIDHLHSLGAAHNDVNPYNIFVEKDGSTAVLGDLDAAARIDAPLGMKRGTRGFSPGDGFEKSSKENDEYGFRKVVEFVDRMTELAAKGQLTSTITYIGCISRAQADRREEDAKKQWEDRQREAYELSMKQNKGPDEGQ